MSLAAEQQFIEKIRALGITVEFLATLTGISPTTLRRVSRSEREFSTEQSIKVLAILRDLERLQKAVAPVPVAFTNPKVIGEILDLRRTSVSNTALTTLPAEGNING